MSLNFVMDRSALELVENFALKLRSVKQAAQLARSQTTVQNLIGARRVIAEVQKWLVDTGFDPADHKILIQTVYGIADWDASAAAYLALRNSDVPALKTWLDDTAANFKTSGFDSEGREMRATLTAQQVTDVRVLLDAVISRFA